MKLSARELIRQEQAIKERRRYRKPVISLDDNLHAAEPTELADDQYIRFDLITTPNAQGVGVKSKISIKKFDEGTPAELLTWKRSIRRVFTNGNAVNAVSRYSVVRQSLSGDALQVFDTAANIRGNETHNNLTLCLEDLTEHVFPANAIRKQKRYLRRETAKPYKMKVKTWVARLQERNRELEFYPGGDANTPLGEDELLDIIDDVQPQAWKEQMLLQGYDPVDGTIAQCIEKAECFEEVQQLELQVKELKKKQAAKVKTKEGKDGKTSAVKAKKSGKTYYCKRCGKNRSHDTPQCWFLKEDRDQRKFSNKKQYFKKKPSKEVNLLKLKAEKDANRDQREYQRYYKAAMKRREVNAMEVDDDDDDSLASFANEVRPGIESLSINDNNSVNAMSNDDDDDDNKSNE